MFKCKSMQIQWKLDEQNKEFVWFHSFAKKVEAIKTKWNIKLQKNLQSTAQLCCTSCKYHKYLNINIVWGKKVGRCYLKKSAPSRFKQKTSDFFAFLWVTYFSIILIIFGANLRLCKQQLSEFFLFFSELTLLLLFGIHCDLLCSKAFWKRLLS
jgi:hypothetical protein